jgi:hypothetical protein
METGKNIKRNFTGKDKLSENVIRNMKDKFIVDSLKDII